MPPDLLTPAAAPWSPSFDRTRRTEAAARPAPARPAAPPHPPLWLRDRALIELMYASGLRASEAGGVSITDLHEPLGVVRVPGKGRKQRLVPIGKPALAAIR